jgi:hypothetical protein
MRTSSNRFIPSVRSMFVILANRFSINGKKVRATATFRVPKSTAIVLANDFRCRLDAFREPFIALSSRNPSAGQQERLRTLVSELIRMPNALRTTKMEKMPPLAIESPERSESAAKAGQIPFDVPKVLASPTPQPHRAIISMSFQPPLSWLVRLVQRPARMHKLEATRSPTTTSPHNGKPTRATSPGCQPRERNLERRV